MIYDWNMIVHFCVPRVCRGRIFGVSETCAGTKSETLR